MYVLYKTGSAGRCSARWRRKIGPELAEDCRSWPEIAEDGGGASSGIKAWTDPRHKALMELLACGKTQEQ